MLRTDATSLARLMVCNGSRLMDGNLPSVGGDTKTRDEGNAAHWLAQEISEGNKSVEEFTDRKAPNGIYITPEIVDHVLDYLEEIAKHDYQNASFEIETSWSGNGFEIAARADFVGLSEQVLHVRDFKYGWRIVEPEGNWTLISHAIGYCIRNGVAPAKIAFSIFQPRPWHIDGPAREWEITYPQLMEYYSQICATLSSPSDTVVTGPQCAKCPGISVCNAARAAAMNTIDLAEAAHSEDLPNAALAFELDNLDRATKMLKDRLDALKQLAEHRLTQGQVINNWHMTKSKGHTRWNDGLDAQMIEVVTGVKVTRVETISPTQAKKKGMDDATLSALTFRPETGKKLTRISAHKAALSAFKTRKA